RSTPGSPLSVLGAAETSDREHSRRAQRFPRRRGGYRIRTVTLPRGAHRLGYWSGRRYRCCAPQPISTCAVPDFLLWRKCMKRLCLIVFAAVAAAGCGSHEAQPSNDGSSHEAQPSNGGDQGSQLPPAVTAEMEGLIAEKAARTPAQRK